LNRGIKGETYNIGGECEKQNIDVVKRICEVLEDLYPIKNNPYLRKQAPNIKRYSDLITFVADRPGHDRRYAINCDKIKKKLGWQQKYTFEEGLRHTISWYLKNREWVEKVRSGEYSTWIEKNYTTRNF
jgi:dTDP-glucose 4,6-dehydratase